MKSLFAILLLAAASLLAISLPASTPLAANAGCVSFNQAPGGHNWQFRNNCGTRVEVAYCVRYAFGNPTMYVGRFSFNNSMTVHLANVPNQITVNHCPTGQCNPSTPPC